MTPRLTLSRTLIRLLALLQLLALLGLLVACGQTPPRPSELPDQTSTSQAPATTTAAAPEGEKTEPLPPPETTESSQEAFVFVYQGTSLAIGAPADPLLQALAEPIHFFESPSCAYQGMDRIYTYPGFEITTYTEGGADYLYAVALIDDSVSTPEGLALGASIRSVRDVYGEPSDEATNQLIYRSGDTALKFVFAEDETVSIEYVQITE